MAEKEMKQEKQSVNEQENPAAAAKDAEKEIVVDDKQSEETLDSQEKNKEPEKSEKPESKKKGRSRKSKSDKLAAENEELRIKLAEAQDKYLRLFSEFDNFRKRSNKEKMDILNSASGALIKELLPVMDDMDRAEENMEKSEDIKAVSEGVVLIFNKFRKILAAKGLEEMDSTGKEFDTDIHEAVAQFPAPEEAQKNTIIDTTEKGYTINGKVIRHAKVVVGV